MARGFESKAVADQQAEAENRRASRGRDPLPDSAVAPRRRGLELARTDAQHRLDQATDDRYRTMLAKAIEDLDLQISQLG